MTIADSALLLLAAALAGALNSVVGGGSFVAFPALLFAHVSPVAANATTAFALWPAGLASAVAYRAELDAGRAPLWWLGGASVVGGGLGALLLLGTSDTTFVRLVPWLLLFATVLFTVGGPLTARLHPRPARLGASALVVASLVQLLVSTYGGYFGGGMGIMMLATWSLLGMGDLHRMNALRSLLGTLINGVALVVFITRGAIAWRPGLLMALAATAAGYSGAAAARRIDPHWVRRFVTAVAWGMTAYFFAKTYRS